MNDTKVLHIEIGRSDAAGPSEPPAATGGLERAVRRLPAGRVMRLLSSRNLELLRLIKAARPTSVTELSRLSGRPKASLTRTLQRLAALGIVDMRRAAQGRGKAPIVDCDCLCVELALTSEDV